jgi:hypothetical protein
MANIYSTGLLAIANGTVSWTNSTIKALIVTDGYTFTKSHEFVTDVTDFGEEVVNAVGTGYERKTLTSKTVTLSSNVVKFDCANITYTAIETNLNLYALIVYAEGTSDANSRLIAYLLIDEVTTNGSDVTINIADVFRFDNA